MDIFALTRQGTTLCPVSGLLMHVRDQWRDIVLSPDFRVSYALLGGRILFVKPVGYMDTVFTDQAIARHERIRAEDIGLDRDYVEVFDLSAVRGISWNSRRQLIRHFQQSPRYRGAVLFNVSPVLGLSLRLARRLSRLSFALLLAADYADAIGQALAVVSQPGPAPALAGASERLVRTSRNGHDILTAPHWYLDLDGCQVDFELIDGRILHSRTTGCFKDTHVAAVEQMRSTIAGEAGLGHGGFPFIVIGMANLRSAGSRARRRYMENLRQWHATRPFRLAVVYGASWLMRTATNMARVFLPFKVKVVDSFDQAMERIAAEERQPVGASQPAARRSQTQTYVDELLESLNRIDWETEGLEEQWLPAPDHPFRPVFDAIAVIKNELDDLYRQRTQAEEALRRSEERYRLIAENTKDLICLAHFAVRPQIVYASPSHKAMGHDPDKLVGRSALDLIHPEDRGILAADLLTYLDKAASAALRGARTYQYRLVKADGNWRHVEGVINVVDGQYLLIVSRDITETRRLQHDLVQARKREAIATLAGGVAHDFNNFLSVVSGYTQLCLEEIDPGSSAHAMLTAMRHQEDRAAARLRQILAVSRHRMYQDQNVDLSGAVRQALGLMDKPETVDLQLNLAPTGATIWADPNQIQQVVMNLIANALDAMRPAGGALTIAVASATDRQAGDTVRLVVADTGCGMAPEVIERIFDPYFTTKDIGQGAGLGLAVVQGVVDRCKGRIAVTSAPGRGTTVAIDFAAVNVSNSAPTPGISG